MSPIAFKNFRTTQTTLDLNGPILSITNQPTNIIVEEDNYYTPFGPATGALPIRKTADGGKVAIDGYRTDPNASDLVLACPFNTNVQDFSANVKGTGSNESITRYGTTLPSESDLQSELYGKSGRFTGGDAYISVDDSDNWYFNGDFTIEGWVWFDRKPTNTNEVVISQWYNNNINSNFKLMHTIDGTLRFFFQTAGSATATFLWDSSVLADKRWYHYAFSLNGTTGRLFLDGKLQESQTITGSSNNSDAELMLGGQDNGSGTGNYMLQNTSYMQDVRVYKGVAKYTANFIPGWSGEDLVDSSKVGIATYIGITTVSLATPNNPGGSASTGNLAYTWYDNNGLLSDGTNYPTGSSGPKSISGAGTSTLTLNELNSPADNGRTFYQKSTYASSTYINNRATGKAWNGPLQTNTVKLTVLPTVTITAQPVGISIGRGEIVTFTSGASTSDTTFGDLTYYWTQDTGDGPVVLNNEGTDAVTCLDDFIGGATTPTLRMKKNVVGVSTIQFHSYQDAAGYRVESKSVGVAFTGVLPRRMLKFEAFTVDGTNLISKDEKNIGEDGAYTLQSSNFGTSYNLIQFYSPEENYNLRMIIKAAAGAANGIYSGGEGGTSTIDLRILKNIEYTLLGVAGNSAIYIYRGSQLMAAVGQGGDAGTTANGGPGGGVGMAGESGDGKDGGTGGIRIATGNLDLTGIWGSTLYGSNVSLYQGDSIAGTPNGGRTISCSRGSYWINKGIGACDNVSDAGGNYLSFRYPDGNFAPTSDAIIRGFKSGYTVSQTSGLAINNGGNGGNGVTGGQGGVGGAGGGGGSGYSDDSFDIISTTLGGNANTTSEIKFEVAV